MPSAILTPHDRDVLEKIKDPESGPSAPLLIDDSLPRDPHITDPVLYTSITERERSIISSIQTIELQIAGLKPPPPSFAPLDSYLSCINDLASLIEDHGNYASARNNRAQALRRIYSDGMLVRFSSSETSKDEAPPLDPSASDTILKEVSATVLTDLTTAIALLTPRTPFAPLSPQAAKTLSQAYTQRGAIYHLTAKRLASSENVEVVIEESGREAKWSRVEFEENASRDFMMGGRFGNEVAKALAVSTNPTAKLCGEMVREAMRKEYAGGLSV